MFSAKYPRQPLTCNWILTLPSNCGYFYAWADGFGQDLRSSRPGFIGENLWPNIGSLVQPPMGKILTESYGSYHHGRLT